MSTRIVTASAALLLMVPAWVEAQQPPRQGPQQDTTQLVFEREVFDYPDYERRNPFRPLVTAEAGGPRFERVRLMGIIYTADPARSVALFGTGAARPQPGQAVQSGETQRLRVGESWGNMRVLEIQATRVIVEVTEFGLTEQRTLELARPSERGTQGGGSR